MADKKQYYKLDEIGFIGTQEKRTKAQVKKDIEMTVEYIKAKVAGNIIPPSQKSTRLVLRAKQKN